MQTYEKIKTHLNYLFLNTAPNATAGSETWSRVGKSTEWTDTMNVNVTTHEYIEDSGPTDVIENYQPSTSMPLMAYLGDPIYEYVFGLYKNQDVSSNAVTKAMRVFQNQDSEGRNAAQMTDCTVTIDNFNFTTGVITFNIAQGGTPVSGTAQVTEVIDASGNRKWTPVFTAD